MKKRVVIISLAILVIGIAALSFYQYQNSKLYPFDGIVLEQPNSTIRLYSTIYNKYFMSGNDNYEPIVDVVLDENLMKEEILTHHKIKVYFDGNTYILTSPVVFAVKVKIIELL